MRKEVCQRSKSIFFFYLFEKKGVKRMCLDSYSYKKEVEQDFQNFFVSLEPFSPEEANSVPVQEIVLHWYQMMQQYNIVSTHTMKEHLQQYVSKENPSSVLEESVLYFLDAFLY